MPSIISSVAKDLSSTLSFQVKNKSVLRDGCLGVVEIKLQKLVELADASPGKDDLLFTVIIVYQLRSRNFAKHFKSGWEG
jgi:hypothetical protein